METCLVDVHKVNIFLVFASKFSRMTYSTYELNCEFKCTQISTFPGHSKLFKETETKVIFEKARNLTIPDPIRYWMVFSICFISTRPDR